MACLEAKSRLEVGCRDRLHPGSALHHWTVVGCRGWSRYVEGVLGFLVSCFLVSWFLGFEVVWFLGFRFLGSKVSRIYHSSMSYFLIDIDHMSKISKMLLDTSKNSRIIEVMVFWFSLP